MATSRMSERRIREILHSIRPCRKVDVIKNSGADTYQRFDTPLGAEIVYGSLPPEGSAKYVLKLNGDGLTDRPDLVGRISYNTRQPLCYIIDSRNPACNTTSSAFVNLPAGALRFGSEGRNTIIGPGLAQTDLGISKNTRFGKDERFNIQFRFEAFNFWNHPNFLQPNVVVNVVSPRFGSITSASRARELQFGMKLEF